MNAIEVLIIVAGIVVFCVIFGYKMTEANAEHEEQRQREVERDEIDRARLEIAMAERALEERASGLVRPKRSKEPRVSVAPCTAFAMLCAECGLTHQSTCMACTMPHQSNYPARLCGTCDFSDTSICVMCGLNAGNFCKAYFCDHCGPKQVARMPCIKCGQKCVL